HAGDWNSGETTRFGWEIASPLEAIALNPGQKGLWKTATQTFLSVDAPNVQMTVLKNSEQPGRGQVVRLVETEGKGTTFTLDVSALRIERAFLCDLVENDREPLPASAGRVKIT